MKISTFCSLFVVLLLTSTSCKKEPAAEHCFANTYISQLGTNPLTKAGYIDCFKDIAEYIKAFKSSAENFGLTLQNVKSVTLKPPYPITVTIPASSGFTFADFSSAEININGLKVATMPIGATGTKIDFMQTGETDVKSIYFHDHPSSIFNYVGFKAQTTKAMPSLQIQIQLTVRGCQL